jgi:tetratricopeptide (TPR) repeat protein
VLELDSRNVKALYRRAQAYIHLVDLDLAEMDIKKALEIDPDNRYALGLVYDPHGVYHICINYVPNSKGTMHKLCT